MKFRDYLGYGIMCTAALVSFFLMVTGASEEAYWLIIVLAILGLVVQMYSFWSNRPSKLLYLVDERTRLKNFVPLSLQINKSFAEIEHYIYNFVQDEELRDELLFELYRARNPVK